MNCDPIARWYRWFEYIGFGGELERRRRRFLPDVADARRILVLGEGDGRFLVRLVEQSRRLGITGYAIDYVDLSGRMLELARRRAGTEGVTYLRADALTVPLPRAAYDLIATHFFLDCFEQDDAQRLIARLGAAAKPNALWLISEFQEQAINESPLRQAWSWLWLRGLYVFFRATTGLATRRVPDYRPTLEQYGFALLKQEKSRFGLLVSELWIRPHARAREGS